MNITCLSFLNIKVNSGFEMHQTKIFMNMLHESSLMRSVKKKKQKKTDTEFASSINLN